MRPTGIMKRPPSYVPAGPIRDMLMHLSKADLAEMVYDYAIRTIGEEEANQQPSRLLDELSQTHVTLSHVRRTGR